MVRRREFCPRTQTEALKTRSPVAYSLPLQVSVSNSSSTCPSRTIVFHLFMRPFPFPAAKLAESR